MRRYPTRIFTWLFMAVLICTASCATPCVVIMQDGRRIEATDRPEVEEGTGFYIFEDAETGKEVRVNKDHIVEIREH